MCSANVIGDFRVGQPRHELPRRHAVHKNLVASATRSQLAILRECYRINRIQSIGECLPINRDGRAHFTFCALIDPKFEQPELFWRKV